jgi:hypothetical protein
MITLFAAVGILTILYFIFKSFSDQKDHEKSLLHLVQHSDECRTYLKTLETKFPPISQSEKEQHLIKLLKNPQILERALVLKERWEKSQEEAINYYEGRLKQQRYLWVREYKNIYLTFFKESVIRENEIRERIQKGLKASDNTTPDLMFQNWKKNEIVKHGFLEGTWIDHSFDKMLAQPIGKYMVRVGDSVLTNGIRGKYLKIIRMTKESLTVQNQDGDIETLTRQVFFKYFDLKRYHMNYSGEFAYQINKSGIYRELVAEGAIPSFETFHQEITSKIRLRQQNLGK